jgi:Tfp pilus assembly protein PilX
VDTAKLANGEHSITATTASGATVKHTVTVNNAPAGAPRMLPKDGTLAAGTQPVFATTPAGGDSGVNSLTVDGEAPDTKATATARRRSWRYRERSSSRSSRRRSS